MNEKEEQIIIDLLATAYKNNEEVVEHLKATGLKPELLQRITLFQADISNLAERLLIDSGIVDQSGGGEALTLPESLRNLSSVSRSNRRFLLFLERERSKEAAHTDS